MFTKTLRISVISLFLVAAVFAAFWGLQGGKLSAQVVAQTPLPGNKIPQFVDPLPGLHVIVDDGSQITLSMEEHQFNMMPSTFVPAVGVYTGTWVWGYRQPGQPDTSHIGPVIVAQRGFPTEIKWINNLGSTAMSNVLAYVRSTDQTLHWADPLNYGMNMQNYAGPVPAVVHLHGGEVPPQLDGGPDAWFTSDGVYKGHAFYSRDGASATNYAIYRYPNTQEAANIWFHDHTLGATRLNVYAGLAGAYILTDPNLHLPANLPGPGDIIPLVIQDRMFDVNGQLYFPNIGINPEHPYWVPEFVGDTIVVNGKVWPYKTVDRQRYRLLFLNGSNARAYDMALIDRVSGVRGPRMWVIGTDGGYLDQPVLIDPNTTNKAVAKSLVMMPGERYDMIIDFNDPVWLGLLAARGVTFPLNTLELQNTAKTPFPAGAAAPKGTTGRIIQFRVQNNAPADTSYNPASGTPLRTGSQTIVRLVNPATGALNVTPDKYRALTLNEVMGPGGPLEVLVNNTKWDGKSVDTETFMGGIRPDFQGITNNGNTTYYSELPQEGHTEVWDIINLTADAHPIHLHLAQFQVVYRWPFNVRGYNAVYDALFPATTNVVDPMTGLPYPGGVFIGGYGPPLDYTTGNPNALGGNPDVTQFLNKKGFALPLPQEQGWKDTVIMYPGEVTRIVVRWAPTDLPTTTPAAQLYFPFDPNGGHGYVWHCHIIDHEDNEMMRPDVIVLNEAAPLPVARSLRIGAEY